MKCIKCPLTLLCYAGRLHGHKSICIKCGKFIWMPPSRKNIYALLCEQRPLTPEMKNTYERNYTHTYDRVIVINDPGPGPGFFFDLRIYPCKLCCDTLEEKNRRDLDEEARIFANGRHS